jgi:hypothetical protein
LKVTGLVILTGIAGWGLAARLVEIQTGPSMLVTRPDVLAAEWIQENTTPADRFVVNNFFAYGGSSIVGNDGGWRLPYLSGRQTNLPPLVYSS